VCCLVCLFNVYAPAFAILLANRDTSCSATSLQLGVHDLLIISTSPYLHRVSVHQAAKLVAALLRVVGVTAGLVESNGSLPPGL